MTERTRHRRQSVPRLYTVEHLSDSLTWRSHAVEGFAPCFEDGYRRAWFINVLVQSKRSP
jgi:hypothetical protein